MSPTERNASMATYKNERNWCIFEQRPEDEKAPERLALVLPFLAAKNKILIQSAGQSQ